MDAIKRVNAIVNDADMYARETIRIPDGAKKGQKSTYDRGHNKIQERSERPKKVQEKAERTTDYFIKFDATVKDNAEKAKSTLDRLRLDDSEDSDGDIEVLRGEGMFELRKWSS